MATIQSVTRPAQTSKQTFNHHCFAYGVPFQLRALDPHTLASMLDVLPFGTEIVAPTANKPSFALPCKRHPHFPALLARLEQQLLLHVAVHATGRTFLHAGVVAWRGRAILLPGTSRAGKTTLVAELVKLGAVYYSDEYALLDPAGFVHPFARDLHMRQPASPQPTRVPVSRLSGKAAFAPAPVAHVVVTEFAKGAQWNPQPLSPGLAVLEMLRHCIPARRKPAHVLTILKAVMRTARACRSPRGEARATAELLLRSLEWEAPLP